MARPKWQGTEGMPPPRVYGFLETEDSAPVVWRKCNFVYKKVSLATVILQSAFQMRA